MDRVESETFLTDDKKYIFIQFKKNVSDVLTPYYTDTILWRFLKTRKFNLKKAEAKFREVDATRKTFDTLNILETYVKPEVIEKTEAQAVFGFTKSGTLLRYYGAGKIDYIGWMKSVCCYDLWIYLIHLMDSDYELLRKESLKVGKELNKVTLICDLEGCSVKQIAFKPIIEMAMQVAYMSTDYYPDLYQDIFVINAPFYFENLFSLFKPVLKFSLLDKIRILSKDNAPEVLLEHIDEDVLPVFLGGSRVDSTGDPKFSELIKIENEVAKEYYAHDRISLLQPTDPDVTCVHIPPRSVYNFCFVAKVAGQKYSLKFRTENGNIQTTLFRREFDPDTDDLNLPSATEYLDENDENSRVQICLTTVKNASHVTPVFSVGKAISPGIHILRFSNMHSWFTPKKLYFRFEML